MYWELSNDSSCWKGYPHVGQIIATVENDGENEDLFMPDGVSSQAAAFISHRGNLCLTTEKGEKLNRLILRHARQLGKNRLNEVTKGS